MAKTPLTIQDITLDPENFSHSDAVQPSDTVPNSPRALDEPRRERKAIALLIPISRIARLAFDSAVDTIKEDSRYGHARRNMVIMSARADSVSVSSVFTDSSVEEEGLSNEPKYRFGGHYVFSLDYLPRNPQRGWVLGDGRGSHAEQVDILLAGPKQCAAISGAHATILPHQQSCRLLLAARHKTIVQDHNGGEITLSTSSSSQIVQLEREQDLRFGDGCSYRFQFLDFADSDLYRSQIAAFMMKFHGPKWEGLLKLLGPSADPTPVRLGPYSWSLGAFAKGTFGQVAAGTKKDGCPVAVKRFVKPKEKLLSEHRRIMSHIGEHAHIVTLLDCHFGSNTIVPEAYCFYKPLASGSLHDFSDQLTLSVPLQITLYRQYLDGLDFLHNKKALMHRDIKPLNLGVVALNPPRAVIFDLDAATYDRESRDHYVGTLGYLAPEMVALKKWGTAPASRTEALSQKDYYIDCQRSRYPQATIYNRCHLDTPPAYGRKVDVWALGVSIYEVYAQARPPRDCITEQNWIKMVDFIDSSSARSKDDVTKSFLKSVRQMLAWDPSKRLSSADALEVSGS